MGLIVGQSGVSPQRGMPTDDKGASTKTVAITGETVAFKYYTSAGVETADAGQAAGVVVVGKIANDNIRNSMGNAQARFNDTSLSFTSTAATTEVIFPSNADQWDKSPPADRAAAIANAILVNNGDYTVDYTTGVIYILKKTTQTSLTSTGYTIGYNIVGGGSVVSSDVNIDEVGGVAITSAGVPVIVSSTAKSLDDSAALEASIVAKAAAGTLYSVTGYNSGAAQFIQIHDAASLPVDTAVPAVSFRVPAASNFAYEDDGRAMANGIVVCNSSTQPTKTIGAADCWFNVTYA